MTWCTLHGSIYFESNTELTVSGLESALLTYVGSNNVFSGSEGSVMVDYTKNYLDTFLSSSDDDFFKRSAEFKKEEIIIAQHIMGRLRHYTDTNTLDSALGLIAPTIERMNENYPIESAIFNLAIDSGESGILYFDKSTGKVLVLNAKQ